MSTVLLMTRSGPVGGSAGPIKTDILDELLFVSGSFKVDDSPTVAVFVIVLFVLPPVLTPGPVTSAAICNVAVELGASVPIVQMPVEVANEVLAEAVACSNVSVEGNVSLATTSVDVVEVLLFVTVTVYFTVSSTPGFVLSTVLLIEMSAEVEVGVTGAQGENIAPGIWKTIPDCTVCRSAKYRSTDTVVEAVAVYDDVAYVSG